MNLHDLSMDKQWLPFTPNRHFKQDPRVFVAADGMHFTTLHCPGLSRANSLSK
jgi:beta-alanine--pyruvate transaminase